jgi:hypothetical protein
MRLYKIYYISVDCSICFGWLFLPLSGAHVTVITASGTGQTVSVIFLYGGAVGTAVATAPP